MKKYGFLILMAMVFFAGCTVSNTHFLKVVTVPPDALVTVHETEDVSSTGFRKVAGTTPLEKPLSFGKTGQLWLGIERRGYAPHIEKVFPQTGKVSVDLERIKDKNGEDVREYALPAIKRLLLAIPDIKIIERGFSSEAVSEEKSGMAREELIKGVSRFFSATHEVITVEPSGDKPFLRPLWRDIRSAMELLDPIRLKYLPEPVFLETKSSLQAARSLGDKYGTEAILFISGRQNLETAGMMAGKIGITAAGTATSYAGGYSRALARGDSFFVYNVYTPSFAEGTLLKAALVDCSNGEVLWVNKGLWGRIPFDDPNILKNIIADLLMDL